MINEMPPGPSPTPAAEAASGPLHPPEAASPIDDPDLDHVPEESARIAALNTKLASATEKGCHSLKDAWDALPDADAAVLNAAMNRFHKPRVLEVERARKPT